MDGNLGLAFHICLIPGERADRNVRVSLSSHSHRHNLLRFLHASNLTTAKITPNLMRTLAAMCSRQVEPTIIITSVLQRSLVHTSKNS